MIMEIDRITWKWDIKENRERKIKLNDKGKIKSVQKTTMMINKRPRQ